MAYQIKYKEITEFKESIKKQVDEWKEGLEGIGGSLSTFITDMGMTGKTADSIQSYLEDIHFTILASLQQIMIEYYENLLLYEDGYITIDTNGQAILTQDTFDNMLDDIAKKEDSFEQVHENMIGILDSISHICRITPPFQETILNSFQTLQDQVTVLREEVGSYEESHIPDCTSIREFITAIQSVIEGQSKKSTSVTGANEGFDAINKDMATMIKEGSCLGDYQSETARNDPNYKKLANRFSESLHKFGADISEVNSVLEKGITKLLEVNKGADLTSTAFSPDPVNLSTGNFIYDKTDLDSKGKHPFSFI